jgi:Zn-dependent M28 family amino/carboxypeptidase
VRALCAERLEALGFAVELQAYATGTNVIGVKAGMGDSDQRVLVAAHYDHIPGCPGADDNASGVAGLLEVARVLAQAELERTLVVACWDEEERGLIGAAAYARRARDRGEQIVANYTFEMIGVKKTEPGSQAMPAGLELLFADQAAEVEANEYRGDFIALIYDTSHSGQAVADMLEMADDVGLSAIELGLSDALKNSNLVADLRRSDHAPFWEVDLPSIMITDTSEFRYPQYHCRDGDDVIDNLDPAFSAQVIQATVGSAALAAGLR